MIVTYIIPAGNLNAVRAKLQQGSDDTTKNLKGILGMFEVPLSATGSGNATHYCSSGVLSTEEQAWLESNLPQSIHIYKGTRTVTVAGVSTQLEWTPWAAFEDKGLSMITAEL
jgi:hypothetical protein